LGSHRPDSNGNPQPVGDPFRGGQETVARKTFILGLQNYSRRDLEELQAAGQTIQIHVLGLVSIAEDVSPELARATIDSVVVLGAFHAPPAVKAALADRIR
jgi:hypothetical protein